MTRDCGEQQRKERGVPVTGLLVHWLTSVGSLANENSEAPSIPRE